MYDHLVSVMQCDCVGQFVQVSVLRMSQVVSATAKSADRPVNPLLSPMARGAPPTMEEKLRMERVARGRRFSLDPDPPRPPPMQRFSLTPQPNTDLISGIVTAQHSNCSTACSV